MAIHKDSFSAISNLSATNGPVSFFRLQTLEDAGIADIDRLPFSIRILLENLLRNEDGQMITATDVEAMARWGLDTAAEREVPFMPARILLQDFTGVPAVVDMAAMRDAARRLNVDPQKINPLVPAELVIDHSVQVDVAGCPEAFSRNVEMEFQRNGERYAFLRWGQKNFHNFKVVPPATGICHQVNLEYLARVVFEKMENGRRWAYPDTLVGLDSHTTMINGIGVMGWGVGGIEAEAVMLGRPYYMLTPEVVGFELTGRLSRQATATDLVLTVTEILREKGVVGKFVEFFGPGLSSLSLEDRATISNMSPEYGATMGFFPVDDVTLEYLRLTGRSEDDVALVEAFCKTQRLFRKPETPSPEFTDTVRLELESVVPCVAGPRRPQERIPLPKVRASFREEIRAACEKTRRENAENAKTRWETEGGLPLAGAIDNPKNMCCDPTGKKLFEVEKDGKAMHICHGSIVIAAITSCTNTSNPTVLLGAAMLAKNAVRAGLAVPPWVKTSLAPGSTVVMNYLRNSGWMPALESLGFHHVAYGCTTCIGNSGPLPESIADVISENDLVVASILSGNRNFEGRINPYTRANYLASPPLVVAYALAGRIDIDFEKEPLGKGPGGQPVYLRDIWPDPEDVRAAVRQFVSPEMYRQAYATVFDGTDAWKSLPIPAGEIYQWDTQSTYIKKPPFFLELRPNKPALQDIEAARVLVFLGDTVTTDHISPAGAIPTDSPAGEYLIGLGVAPEDFNSYGSRRGNHEVMMRGTFGNIRLQNQLVPEKIGGWTLYFPENKVMSIYDAAMKYARDQTPLMVIAGKEYGTGSSRDWAAKGTKLLGVRTVIAESFERIHRSNLVCMGVLPLQFPAGQSRASLGLKGTETFTIRGIADGLTPGKLVVVQAARADGDTFEFEVQTRLDSPVEVEYYQHGGILSYVLRNFAAA